MQLIRTLRYFGLGFLLAFTLPITAVFAQTAANAPDSPTTPRLTVGQLRTKYADKQSRFMPVKGMEIHYKDEGPRRAPILLMIHGSQSSLRTWDRITALMKKRYRVIRLDIPGYGLSSHTTDEAAQTVQPVEVVEGLLDGLGIKKIAAAIGVSSGGTMAMYLAAKRPELVERLILSNTPSDPVDTSHLVQTPAFLAAQDRARKTGYQDLDFWDQYLSFFAGDPARISAKTKAEYWDFNRRSPEKHPIAMVARIGDGKQAAIEMAKITAPTFLLWGSGDPLLPEAAVHAITRYLKNATISKVLMPDVGHYPPLEVPDRFARWIETYVEAGVPKP
ncbi:3-oxoadipate enol-lactonase [Novosphingobium sp. AAP83]|uniref:alpha/beta fold hydrolase n=1 Tax=Novosphingobium sp. AAP83 TaxID=1523425 RepID=UPI0006B9DEBA|nr:alpha/beta hydrolase [Novosphingobium sp. AAP83]KPF90818.1 3-oxoadipate enol-lactonase [Novosphingobium sp. AAP83]